MKKLLKPKFFLAPTLVAALALAACSGDDDGGTSAPTDGGGSGGDDNGEEVVEGHPNPEASSDGLYSADDFVPTIEPMGEAIGGTLNYGLVSPTPFQGTLNGVFYSGAPDGEILEWFGGGLFTVDENFAYTDEGAATIEVSEDGRTFTITIRDNVNWHDGEPVTAEDYAFAYEVIANPDYTGPRFSGMMREVEGIMEYRDGEADSISGIEVHDEKSVSITFNRASPSLMASGLWSSPLAKHIFGDMEIADMEASPEVRENPIGFGPFKVESIVPGESVTLTKNEDYWQGEPKLDGVTISVVNNDVVAQSMRSGDLDMVNFPDTQFIDNQDMDNVNWIGRVGRGYSYNGFKLGTWDAENGEVATDLDGKMGDINLRQAMAHAVDYDALGESIYAGLRFNATTVIPPFHPYYHDADNEGLAYDVDLANQLLDDAGYAYDGDYRQTPDGEDLVINFAAMTGDATAEPVANYQIQAWRDIGLNVQLLDGSLHEFNSFYDRVGETGEDDPEIDIYAAGWSVGYDVDPSNAWGGNAIFNFTRYNDDTMNQIFEDGNSEEAAVDMEYRREVYNDWQAHVNEMTFAFPTLYRTDIIALNKRVSGHSFQIGNNDLGFHTIQLSEENAVVD